MVDRNYYYLDIDLRLNDNINFNRLLSRNFAEYLFRTEGLEDLILESNE